MGKVNLEEIQKEIMESRKLAWEAYAKIQADNEIPAWIILNGGTSESRIGSGVWAVRGYFYKHHILPPGISWERRENGINELVCRDLETGREHMLLTYDVRDEEFAFFFEAEVDLASRTVIVKNSVAVNQLRPEDFMLRYDNFDLTKAWRFDQSWEQNRLNILGKKSR